MEEYQKSKQKPAEDASDVMGVLGSRKQRHEGRKGRGGLHPSFHIIFHTPLRCAL